MTPDHTTALIGMPLLQVFGRMGCGGVILSTSGQVLAANAEARRSLGAAFDVDEAELDLHHGNGRALIKQLLVRARVRLQLDGGDWLVIQRPGRRPLIMNPILVPVHGEEAPHTVLLLIDLDQVLQPNTAALERIFGLTGAEAKLAALLVRGVTVTEAAAEHGVSVATVRTQLAAIFAKTNTRRQAELVMLISRLSALL